MQDQSSGWINRLVTLAFALSIWALAPSIASADRVTSAHEPIVISDDITNYTQEVRSADGVTDDAAAIADAADSDSDSDSGGDSDSDSDSGGDSDSDSDSGGDSDSDSDSGGDSDSD